MLNDGDSLVSFYNIWIVMMRLFGVVMSLIMYKFSVW